MLCCRVKYPLDHLKTLWVKPPVRRVSGSCFHLAYSKGMLIGKEKGFFLYHSNFNNFAIK